MDTITLHHPRDALAVIPHLLRYYPRHHFVLFGGSPEIHRALGPDGEELPQWLGSLESSEPPEVAVAGGETPLIRVDLRAGPISPYVARQITDAVAACRMFSCVAVVYCPSFVRFAHTREFASVLALLELLCAALSRLWDGDPGTRDAWSCDFFIADNEGFMDMGEETFCRWEELESTEAAAALVYKGSAPLDQEPSRNIVKASPTRMRNTAAAMEEARGEEVTALEEHWDMLLSRVVRRRKAGPPRITTREAGRALAGLTHIPIRDKILQVSLEHDPLLPMSSVDPAVGFATGVGERPNIVRALGMMALLDELARLAPEGVEVPYACSAYLAWWVGQNSMTALRAQEALEINSGSRLARMLKDAAEWNALPPWLLGPNGGGRCSRAKAGSGGEGDADSDGPGNVDGEGPANADGDGPGDAATSSGSVDIEPKAVGQEPETMDRYGPGRQAA
ncbi:hypothetical protein R6G78_00610 [Actinotignum timonense]|uniref:hypothetical protein n=1 Tax=Actinotignum timonense TaxID=1870995 RepID=UPI002A82B2C9|nr:hypothetical protein [Actinotignum timonense]MDY5143716.1 hypothetical protein [Actinotignum timonense]